MVVLRLNEISERNDRLWEGKKFVDMGEGVLRFRNKVDMGSLD